VRILVEQGFIMFSDVGNGLVAMLVDEIRREFAGPDRRLDGRTLGLEFFVEDLVEGEGLKLGPQGFVFPDQNLVFNEIHNANEAVFFSEGELNRGGIGGQAGAHGADTIVKVRPHSVHLVHEGDAGYAVAVGLPPDGFRLRLNAGHGVKDGHSAVEHTQGAFHLHGKIHVAGSIDNVDAVLIAQAGPEGGGGRGGDGNAALALLVHPVHRRRAVVHFADAVVDPRVVEDAFGRSGLAGVDVRHDSDVAQFFERNDPRHNLLFLVPYFFR
jgi:hypothetical protein